MNRICQLFVSVVVLYFGVRAFAQVNPSSPMFFHRPAATEASGEVNLDSGRYKVLSSPSKKSSDSIKSKKTGREPASEAKAAATSSSATHQTQQVEQAPEIKNESTNIIENVQNVVLGDQEQIVKYRSGLSRDDSRQNLVDLSLAPMMIYSDAKSNSWYRDYRSDGVGVGVQINLWTNPFFGLQAEYARSLTADIDADTTSPRRVKVDHQMFALGFRYRKFFNMTRKSPVITFGFDYDEYQMLVPKKEDERIRLKTSAPAAVFEVRLPTSHVKSFVFGSKLAIDPKVEEQKTALELKSGSKDSTQSFQFYFGQDFTFNRHQTFFWKFKHRFDKSVYEGTSNQNEPVSGTPVEGVSVRTGTSLIQVGFSWGG